MKSELDIAYVQDYLMEKAIHFKRIEKKHKGDGYRLSNSMRISMELQPITLCCFGSTI